MSRNWNYWLYSQHRSSIKRLIDDFSSLNLPYKLSILYAHSLPLWVLSVADWVSPIKHRTKLCHPLLHVIFLFLFIVTLLLWSQSVQEVPCCLHNLIFLECAGPVPLYAFNHWPGVVNALFVVHRTRPILIETLIDQIHNSLFFLFTFLFSKVSGWRDELCVTSWVFTNDWNSANHGVIHPLRRTFLNIANDYDCVSTKLLILVWLNQLE